MIRLTAAFLILFLGAVAFVALMPSPPKVVAAPSPVATQLRHEADPMSAQSAVRIVYPGPTTDPSQVRNDPVAITSPAASVTTAVVYPQAASPSDGSNQVQPDQAALAGGAGVNLNTASIDALNQIPGAGRIGRTIASHRPYHTVEDLLTKRVVKKSVYDRIKDQVAAD